MKILSSIVLLGLIDSVQGRYVTVEISGPARNVEILEIPSLLFPCEISEGDFFHIVEVDGVTELRCGEPPV